MHVQGERGSDAARLAPSWRGADGFSELSRTQWAKSRASRLSWNVVAPSLRKFCTLLLSASFDVRVHLPPSPRLRLLHYNARTKGQLRTQSFRLGSTRGGCREGCCCAADAVRGRGGDYDGVQDAGAGGTAGQIRLRDEGLKLTLPSLRFSLSTDHLSLKMPSGAPSEYWLASPALEGHTC